MVREDWNGSAWALGFGNGQFLLLRYTDGEQALSALTSGDGRTWTEQTLNGLESFPVSALVYAQGSFILVGHPPIGHWDPGRAKLYSSTDGLSWRRRLGDDETVFAMAAGGNGAVALLASSWDDRTPSVRRSDTGVEWPEVKAQGLSGQSLSSVAYGNGLYMAAGGSGIFTSADGVTWSRQSGAGGQWGRVRYGAGKFLALAEDGGGRYHQLGMSSDGVAWTTQRLPSLGPARDVAASGQSVVVVGQQAAGIGCDGVILRSADLVNWSQFHLSARQPYAVAFGNDCYVVLAGIDPCRAPDVPVNVLISTDGVTWTEHASTIYGNDLVFANNRFYAAGWTASEGAILFSSMDGLEWKAHSTGLYSGFTTLSIGSRGLFALGGRGEILHSPWDFSLDFRERTADGMVHLLLSGATGQTLSLQAASILSPPNWQTISTHTLGAGALTVTDPEAAKFGQRFYRATVP